MTDNYTDYSKPKAAIGSKPNCLCPLTDMEKAELKLRIALAIGEGISKA